MDEPSNQDNLLEVEFNRERSVRRTLTVLQTKRKRIRDELQQLVNHLNLLIPITGNATKTNDPNSRLIEEAIERLGDDAFGALLRQILQENQP